MGLPFRRRTFAAARGGEPRGRADLPTDDGGRSFVAWMAWTWWIDVRYTDNATYGYGSIPINTMFRGMNIHLPAILMFTRGTRF